MILRKPKRKRKIIRHKKCVKDPVYNFNGSPPAIVPVPSASNAVYESVSSDLVLVAPHWQYITHKLLF